MFEPYEYKETVAKKVILRSVYLDEPKLPNGYKAVAFRPPKMGEQYLSPISCGLDVAGLDFGDCAPRIILEPKPKRKVLVIEYDVDDTAPPSYSDYKRVGADTARYYTKSKLYNARIEERD